MDVHRALQLFIELDEADDEDIFSSSSEEESDAEDKGVKVEDSSFVADDERDHEQPGPSAAHTVKQPTQREQRRSQTRSRSPQGQTHQHPEPWKTEMDPDTGPQTSRFLPHRTPGPQVNLQVSHSPLDLFKLYFSAATMRTLCRNTNKYAAINQQMGERYNWADVEAEELYKFLGLLIYSSLVSLPSIQDYWEQNCIMSVPFPASVMSRDRFRSLLWNIHLSDPEDDIKNYEKKGTPQHDKLFRTKPLLDDIRSACQAHYHPRRELAVNERTVAMKAKTGITQYLKDKPVKRGMKLFALADLRNGYTVNFNIYVGKTKTVHGLSYDAVMSLIQPTYLGTGYHIYMDNFYTSPQLLHDLASMKFGACGTYRENKRGCPTGRANALSKTSERGSMRWIREGPLLFVKWMDTREVSICSTIHPAFSGEMIQRKMKEEDGRWAVKNIPCPTPVAAYNKSMGGLNLSDQLTQYYSTHWRVARWYRTLFLHFVDIATTNAYILSCDIRTTQQEKHMTHKNFLLQLASQLCGVDNIGVPLNRRADHLPVAIVMAKEPHKKATQGRRTCQHCLQMDKKRNLTPWKCKSCDVALCVIVDRNCFEKWHR